MDIASPSLQNAANVDSAIACLISSSLNCSLLSSSGGSGTPCSLRKEVAAPARRSRAGAQSTHPVGMTIDANTLASVGADAPKEVDRGDDPR